LSVQVSMADTESASRLKESLQRTWYPFYARFGRPTKVQALASGPILAGRDVLLCSPSASGKTEAFLAPLVERHVRQDPAPVVTVVIVSPTRALVNDLARRITSPLSRMGLHLGRRTGDHKDTSSKRRFQVLVTTPESLDSMLVRQPSMLKGLGALVLDEIHVLDKTTRGDQLRILVERIRVMLQKRGTRLQTIVSSATLEDTRALALRYLQDPECIIVNDQREIDAEFCQTPTPFHLLKVLSSRLGGYARKILVFLQRRDEVEFIAGLATSSGLLGSRVYSHHGSLAKAERERVEGRFLKDPSAVCFATTTLELGIDIGDVDLVALVGPAGSVSSLIQRIGRGNRRRGECRLLACARTKSEELQLRHQVAMARQGKLYASHYAFTPSVLAQQAGSMLMQSRSGWIDSKVFVSRLPADIAAMYPAGRIDRMFEIMAEKGWLKRGGREKYMPGDNLIRAMEKGSIHSNIDSENTGLLEVVEESTGQKLGRIAGGPEAEISIGGKARHVLSVDDKVVVVQQTRDLAEPPRFSPRSSPLVSRPGARSFGKWLGVEEGSIPMIRLPEKGAVLFHFQGSLGGKALAGYLKAHAGWTITLADAYFIAIEDEIESRRPFLVTYQLLEDVLVKKAGSLKKMLSTGPFVNLVPGSWVEEFLVESVDCKSIASEWSDSRIEEVKDKDMYNTLSTLVQDKVNTLWRGKSGKT